MKGTEGSALRVRVLKFNILTNSNQKVISTKVRSVVAGQSPQENTVVSVLNVFSNEMCESIWAAGPAQMMLTTSQPLLLLGEAESSFGFNFDLIETNIINLAVVIAVVLYLGSDVLSSLLNDRKQKILSTIQSADERYLEAQQKLEQAKAKVEQAKTKAVEIRQQGNSAAAQATKTLFERTEEEIRRLEETKQASLREQEDKALSQVREQVIKLSIERATAQLRTKMDNSTQKRLIDYNIGLLGKIQG